MQDDFYSRPCGRGDKGINPDGKFFQSISTHAPAGGATETGAEYAEAVDVFLLTPLREGRHSSCRPRFARTTNISTHAPAGGATRRARIPFHAAEYFYSRPCGRGDAFTYGCMGAFVLFLLTPLREGRPSARCEAARGMGISTHAPAGGATGRKSGISCSFAFLLTPLREGRLYLSQ